MSSTSVKVAVRVRPMAAKELLAESSECVEIIRGTQQIMVGGGPKSSFNETMYSFTQKSFTFDHLFDDSASQTDLYNMAVSPLVERYLDGFNATILAYGQTGSGKTYSMGIGMESIASDADASLKGIVPRAISAIFETLNFKKSQNESFECLVSVSFLELYNEELIDLLNPKARNTPAPVIREDANGQIIWQNLSEEHVNSVEELIMYYILTRVLEKGTLCRTTASTDMNATSSRSHAIFTVNLRQSFTQVMNGEDGTENNVKSNLVSKFHFVDLAGSERLKRTNAEGNRKKEGISINQGLLALGNVISALGDENRKSSHVPYRDSKLTRMLQDSLGGNSQTLMLACISPSDLNYGETVNTLHYANRARNIRNKVEINQDWGSNDSMREIRSLRSTISQLRTEIAMIKANGVQNKDCAIAELGSVTNPKQLAYYQRRERDLMSEIAALKLKLSAITFRKDQFQFLSCRLEDRVRKLIEENSELLKERDIAVSEKCSLLNLGSLDSKRLRLSDIGQGLVKRSRSPSPDVQNRNEIIGNHLKTIRNLRLQLSNSEDKLAWQQEAMCKLSQKSTQPRLGWDEFAFAELGVDTTPELSVFERIKNENKPSFSRQKQILEAMRENIELKAGPVEKQGTEIKQILTKIQEDEDEFGSRLKLRKPYAADNESRDDTPETDLFLLINSIQNDISRHETLMEQNLKREEDYERMQRVYESKLKDLQQKLNNVQTESKYDSERQKIDSEISDTKRKMGENHRLRADNRARNDKLTSGLQATISGLKAEKSRMLQELRQLTLKHRDEHLTNMKEIAQLRRKEKATSDTVKKLEKSNEIQKMMLKKRTDEINSSKQKLKKIMNSLKRAPTPNKISKSHSRPASPAHGLRQRNHPSTNEYLASVSSPMRVSVAKVIRDADAGQIDVKAQFKKQMVDKELTSAISYKRTQRELEKLQFCRNRLIEEQKELLSERKRVVEAHFQKTKIFDEKSPQYMDERVQSIDKEVASIDSSMSAIESSLRSKIGAFKDMAITSAIDASWENALNLVKTLTRAELEATIAYFFEDLIELRITEDELYQEIESKDNLMEGLRENVNALKEKIRPDEIFVDDVSENLTKPSLKSSPSIVTKSSDLEEAVHIQTINEIQGEQNFGTRIIPQRGLSRTTSALLPPLEPKRLSQGPPFIIETARIPSLEESKEDDHKQRKKFDILTLPGSSDVFKRLAQSHTLASQAKVIQRSSMDKDLTDSCVSEDSKRRTLSDMTNPVYSDKI